MKVNGKDYPIYYGKIKNSKPPTSIYIWNRKLGRIHVLIKHWYFPHDKSSFSHEKNKVTRTYTTVCFWHPCAKTPHVLSFFQWPISTSDDEKFQEPFFHLACGRHVSLRHVVAIDPLIDSIPDSSIDGWASAVLHLTGAIFLRWFRQRSVCWVSATFVFVQACKKVTST